MKFFYTLVMIAILCVPVGGDNISGQAVESLDFSVMAPTECEVGELVRMKVDGEVDGILWEIKPVTPDFEVINEGRRAFFSGRVPGEFLIIVAAAKGGKPYLHYQTLTVKGEPTPVSELTARITALMKKLPAGSSVKIKQVAGVFRKLATSDTPIDKMLEATALANSAIIGDDLDAWVPFLDGLGTELDNMVNEDKLDTRDQYRVAWLEIAAVLERGP